MLWQIQSQYLVRELEITSGSPPSHPQAFKSFPDGRGEEEENCYFRESHAIRPLRHP